jgi:hypothetical protein
MHWQEFFGKDRGELLRLGILAALEDTYAENSQRFAPDDLGDNNTTFGVSVSQNLRFLAERGLQGIAGIAFCRPRGSFAVVVDRRYWIHFYKAPPAVDDVRELRFDSSATQQEIVESNAEQLAWRFDPPGGAREEPDHLVVVHFGDPVEGFRRADAGVPLQSPADGLQWAWLECLSDPGIDIVEPWYDAPSANEMDEDADFDLRMRSTQEDHDMNDQLPGSG